MNSKIEDMSNFFDLRAKSYDTHMKKNVDNFNVFYKRVSKPIIKTNKKVNILDLGCGTGLELKNIFKKCPNAQIDCLDLSKEMLEVLKEKYKDRQSQIKTITASYLDYSFKEQKYDYILSVMSFHHILHKTKLNLYISIFKALNPDGLYIEGEYVVNQTKESRLYKEYLKVKEEKNIEIDGTFHIDIPFSIKTQKQLFDETGFKTFQLHYHENEAAVYSVKK
jgi:tRNA (cmo5U34)-methyltransferase